MRTAFALIALALFLLADLKPLSAQEIETSVDKPTEAPSFTFRKRRVGMAEDARVKAILGRIRRHQHYPALARESGGGGRGHGELPDSARRAIAGFTDQEDLGQRISRRRFPRSGAKSGAPALAG